MQKSHITDLPPPQQWLIVTDLDGTLLDHHTYSFAAAEPTLAQLRQLAIPVILNSSKTLAELQSLATQLQLASPLIAENGSVIHDPITQTTQTLGQDYRQICQTLDYIRHAQQLQFQGFHDWDASGIAQHTGLPLPSAQLASQRHASEPLLWQDTPERLSILQTALHTQGLTLKRGGRFWHVMGQTDKVQAMRVIAQHYAQQRQHSHFIIALGDGPNDAAMLEAADLAIVIANPDGATPSIDRTGKRPTLLIPTPAPQGWADAIQSLLQAHYSP